MAQSFFDSVLAATDPHVDAVFGKSFVYRNRGLGVALTAILSAHNIELDEGADLRETVHSHAFEVTAADLVLDGTTVLPVPGAEFVEPNSDGTSTVYEVVKGPRGRCYDAIDSEGRRLLVFTVETRRRELP